MIGEDVTGYFFSAGSPGFSLFAIAAEGGAIVANKPTTQPTTPLHRSPPLPWPQNRRRPQSRALSHGSSPPLPRARHAS